MAAPHPHRGFTLLELLVVLTILGLIAGMAVVRLKEPYHAARLGDALQRVATMDRQARGYVERFGRDARLVYDLDKHLAYVESSGAEHREYFRTVLSGGVRVDRIRTVDRQTDQGQFTIDLSPSGQNPSYAVCLNIDRGPGRWLFFAGLTGQVLEIKTQDDVQSLFEMLRYAGDDAD